MTSRVGGLDLDGTLFHLPNGSPGNGSLHDIRRQLLDRDVMRRVRQLEEELDLHWIFPTGRNRSVAEATLRQLTPLWPDAVERLHLQDSWQGSLQLQGHKAAILERFGAVLHVGDGAADLAAAAMAGTPFVHVDAFRAGDDLDHLWCHDCGCTSLRACITDAGPCSWTSATVCSACTPEVLA